MPLRVDYNILNQKGTPAFYSDTFANRPAAGFAGRVFISTDTGAIYEDTGTTWTLIADAGAGTTGTLQQVTTNGNTTTQGITITAGGLSSNSLTSTGLTTGSVLFSDGGGLISQKNAQFFWDNTNNRLGIGNAAPGTKLDIHGTGTIAHFNGTGANDGFLAFQNAGTTKWTIGNQYAGGVNNFQIKNSAGTAIYSITGSTQSNFSTNTVVSGVFTANNVGDQIRVSGGVIDASIHTYAGNNLMYIGDTSTGTKGINIDLSTGYLSSVRYILSGATGNTGLYYGHTDRVVLGNYTAGGIDFETNAGTVNMTLFPNGNLGVGAALTDAGYKLQINGTGRFTDKVTIAGPDDGTLQIRLQGTAAPTYYWELGREAMSTGDFRINESNAGTVTNRLVIKPSTGNLLIGTTTDAGYKLDVNGTVRISNNLYLNNNQGLFLARADNTIGQALFIDSSNNLNVGYGVADTIRFGTYLNTLRMSISSAGVVLVSNLAGTGSRTVLADASGNLSAPVSDISVKENIQPIGYGLNEIVKMNPVWFDYINEYKNMGESRQNGNIAQDMEKIIPEAVFITPSTGKMGINYDQLHAVYIKAIQELKAEIDQLKNN